MSWAMAIQDLLWQEPSPHGVEEGENAAVTVGLRAGPFVALGRDRHIIN